MNNFFQFNRYLFVFAHPDDEIYSCAFIHQLVQKDKDVRVLYVTSGDYQGAEFGPLREHEVHTSMGVLGVKQENIHFLRIPERELMGRVAEVSGLLSKKVSEISPDCIITHDFEGGHNGHDAVSFTTSRVANNTALYVFSAYHGWPEARVWNQFVRGQQATDTLELTDELRSLKSRIVAIHESQDAFFQTILKSSSADFFMSREILRAVDEPIDYSQKPTDPVGYEYPESKIRFEDFKASISI